MFDGIKYWCKIEGKLTCPFKNKMTEFSKFSPEHVGKSKNWDFYCMVLSKVENV